VADEQQSKELQDPDEFQRRSADLVRVGVGAAGAAICGLWAQAGGSVDSNLGKAINGLGSDLESTANAIFKIGSIWAVVAVVVLLIVLRRPRAALAVALGGAVAFGAGSLLNEILGPRSASALGVTVRTGDGPTFPSVEVAVITAMAIAVSPYIARPVRRASWLLIALVAFAVVYLGEACASDALGGWFVGLAAGASALAILRAPSGRLSATEIRDALGELGFDVAGVASASVHVPRARSVDVTLASGGQLRVDAFGRDQRDGQFNARLWHAAMYKEPGSSAFGSRIQQVDHVAYSLMLAEREGVHAPRLVKTGIAGPDAAMLVTSAPAGTPIGELAVEQVTDQVLASAWNEVQTLHNAGIAHGQLDAAHLLVSPDGTVTLDDFSASDTTAQTYWRDRDVAAVLVTTALQVGNERAIAAAVTTIGKERVGEVIAFVQPAALPRATTHGTKHLGKALKALRADLATATGVEDVKPLKIKRLDWANIGMLIGVLVALALVIPSLESIDFQSVQSEFENADWGWIVLAAAMYPLIITSWATALMGCVNMDLPFVPTVLTQLACTFLNLVTPNGIGGTALQLDYLHHQGVPVASGGSAMVLSTGVGGAIQMALLLGAAAYTSTSLDLSAGGSASLWAIAIGAALIGVVLAVPKIRGKVIPAVKRAADDIWSVLRNPKKGMQLFGGDLAGNLLYPALLGLCLLAFHQNLSFAQLIVVQMGAGILGNVAPVPGGIGVQEAALTAGLTSFGIPPAPALATVLVFRAITFAIPPFFGFFTLRWLRKAGYA
jgi:uncharacterized membrane protein YbhN (UPF0104 family)